MDKLFDCLKETIPFLALIVAICVGVSSIRIAKRAMESSRLIDFLSMYKSLNITQNLSILKKSHILEMPKFITFYKNEVRSNGTVQKPLPDEYSQIYDIMESVFFELVLTNQIMTTLGIKTDDIVSTLIPDIAKYRIITDKILKDMEIDPVYKDGIHKYLELLDSAKKTAKKNGLKFEHLTLSQ